MPISEEQLSNLLLENRLVTEKDLQDAKQLAHQEKISLHEAIVRKNLLTDKNLGFLIADFLNVPFIELSQVFIPSRILNIIPEMVAKKHKIIAFKKDKDGLHLAMADPSNDELKNFIAKKTGDRIIVHLATENDIKEALLLYKRDIEKDIEQLLKKQVETAKENLSEETHISQLVDLLIEYAFNNRASDIHIEPEEKESRVRFRIDGVLHNVLNLPIELHDQVISRIKVLAKLRTDEHLSAQDGKIQKQLGDENVDIRVSIAPIVEGEKAVLRLLSSQSRQFSLANIGLKESDLAKITKSAYKPYGMILATGPTGCGKTTTIYTILKILNTQDKNIATIEDPVEYSIPNINQIQVNPKTNLTFAKGLRSILRQDPDIIFVGEIRDEETASIAVNAAMTGHLVLSTMHTNDAATALPRLIDMKIEPYLVASTVNVIIAQRLVRKICEKCRHSIIISRSELLNNLPKELVEKYFNKTKTVRIYQGKGCKICHFTGYAGRIGIFEVLEVTDKIRSLINAKKDSEEITAQAIKEGMTTMIDDGLDKVTRGITTLEEILKATKT